VETRRVVGDAQMNPSVANALEPSESSQPTQNAKQQIETKASSPRVNCESVDDVHEAQEPVDDG
jgi:hypothetical protein